MFMNTKRKSVLKTIAVAGIALPLVSACIQQKIINNGPVITQDQLDLVPIGSSQDQVLLALDTPSTKGQFNSEVFYYISQKRAKTFEYEKLKLVDQKVLSVYFDDNQTVQRIANYGLKDGRVFDFISRTTSTGGEDFTFLRQVFTGRASASSVLGGNAPADAPGSSPGSPGGF